jgi:hypothetical protein
MTEDQAVTNDDPSGYRWHHKLLALVFSLFTLILGMILVVFPWSDAWLQNYVVIHSPWLREYWLNPYLRGAVSGLGVLNIFISLGEAFRLRRFSG